MNLNEEVNKISPVVFDESYKWLWGEEKDFPESYAPALVVTDEASPFYGILFCNLRKDKFLIGHNQVIKSLDFDTAMALMDKCDISSSERGGAREGAGRKPSPKGARRRTLTVTDGEYSRLTTMLALYRIEPVDYSDAFSNPTKSSEFLFKMLRENKNFLTEEEAVAHRKSNQVVVQISTFWFVVDRKEWKSLFYKYFSDDNVKRPKARHDLIIATMQEEIKEGTITIDVQGALARMRWNPIAKERAKEIAREFCARFPMYKVVPEPEIPVKTDSVFVVLKTQ